MEKVASNRRIYRDENGVIKAMRGSSCKDPKLRAMTEGTIDPMLKTISFYNKDQCVAAIHYYATHPMSYYGDGLVTSDFVGIARKRLQQELTDCHHILLYPEPQAMSLPESTTTVVIRFGPSSHNESMRA